MKLFQRNNPENKQVEEHGCCQGEGKQDMKKSKNASCGCEHDESHAHEAANETSHGCC